MELRSGQRPVSGAEIVMLESNKAKLKERIEAEARWNAILKEDLVSKKKDLEMRRVDLLEEKRMEISHLLKVAEKTPVGARKLTSKVSFCINEDMTPKDEREIDENFSLSREAYDEGKGNVTSAMYLAAAYDNGSEAWTNSSPSILEFKRLAVYAKSSSYLLTKLIVQGQMDSLSSKKEAALPTAESALTLFIIMLAMLNASSDGFLRISIKKQPLGYQKH
ncbi:Nrap protein [Artemisia annua]|uniref:Nrap protein n=1 Tax=Artemisia annua TaxID=35608 RepID=A0A2U1NX23_ARTAN|nr:Nrap protein [Artemisia annua]